MRNVSNYTRLLLISGVLLFSAFQTQAGPTFSCDFSTSTSIKIDYEVIGGTRGFNHSVTGGSSGAVDFTEALHDLVPDATGADLDDSSLRCRRAGAGEVSISFLAPPPSAFIELNNCRLCFSCSAARARPVVGTCN